MEIRRATAADITNIMRLYYKVYGGEYPDAMMSDFNKLNEAFDDPNLYWYVGISESNVIASVLYKYNRENLLAKAYGAVVDSDYRGHNITRLLMDHAQKHLSENSDGLDIIYATTRTVNASAQTLTEKQGYKKLGIFPNVRKTRGYETHCLAALFSKDCFSKRFTDFKLHSKIKDIYQLVETEFNLPKMEFTEVAEKEINYTPLPWLELIKAPNFVQYRFNKLKKDHKLQLEFYPFHDANILITSPDQTVEIFANLEEDGYCAILGGRIAISVDYKQLMLTISEILRSKGARYLEIIIRSDQTELLDRVLKAKFIPSAYFPAFQLINSNRYDFTVLSRSFEIFDFQNVELKGKNEEFLKLYFHHWEQVSLGPKLLKV